MKKLSVQLNQDYKSFDSGFSYELQGNLIILSGVNGSGKSQLIDIISQRESHDNPKAISATIKLDDRIITRDDILRRTFKENIGAPDLTRAGTEIVRSHKEKAWSNYHRHRLNHQVEELWNYKESCEEAKKILIEEFGESKFNSGKITQIELQDKLPNSFVWRSDDIFTNVVGELFFNYAVDILHAKAKASEKGNKFEDSSLPVAPWLQLNELFVNLGLEYRFKDNYFIKEGGLEINEQPSLYHVVHDGSLDVDGARKLADLSDGEKSIIALSFASLSGAKHVDKKILLLDEFDANFNPSLTEIFYKILDQYFISKGILVIIATHSPTTISLASENATFYEVFKKNLALTSRILPVQKNDYEELKIANKTFYDKMADQNERILELEKKNKEIDNIQQTSKPALVVEDKYDQIYKIAWLKVNDIAFNNDDADIENKFNTNANFQIFGFESARSVAGLLRSSNMDFYKDKKVVGLFDFDEEGSEQFYFLKKSQNGWSDDISGGFTTGFYKKRSDHPCFYALLLPVPESLKNTVSDIRDGKFTSFVVVENLLPEDFLTNNNFCVEETVLDCKYLKIKDEVKNKLWQKLSDLEKDSFDSFKPLFSKVNELLDLENDHGTT